MPTGPPSDGRRGTGRDAPPVRHGPGSPARRPAERLPPPRYGALMRATVRDVAALAGVSPKTVSNVVNGGVVVRPETRARVEAAVVELGYVPNLSARGLRNGRTGAIAVT